MADSEDDLLKAIDEEPIRKPQTIRRQLVLSDSESDDVEVVSEDPKFSKPKAKVNVRKPKRRFGLSSSDEDDTPTTTTIIETDSSDLALVVSPNKDQQNTTPAQNGTSGSPGLSKYFSKPKVLAPVPKRVALSSSSDDDKKTNGLKPPEKKAKVKNSYNVKRPAYTRVVVVDDDDDEDENDDGPEQIELGDDEYEEDELLDIIETSESDEEPESPVKKKASPKKQEKLASLKDEAVNFLNNATESELMEVSGVSKKTVESIIALRQFTDWHHARRQLEDIKGTRKVIIEQIVKTLQARREVNKIMSNCTKLSDSITTVAENIKPTEQPVILNRKYQLKDYQLIGLNWLMLMYEKNTNAILADEMGLGKTIQVIAFLAALREKHFVTGPHLIVVPSSTLDNWDREFAQWCKKIDILVYHGTQAERELMREDIKRKKLLYDVLLTTYDIVKSKFDRPLFKKTKFKYAIYDEAHMLKNMKSNRYEELLQIPSHRRLMLTGTPLQNNLLELMSLLMFTVPHMFQAKTDHIKSLFTSNAAFKKEGAQSQTDFEQEKIELAKKIMKPFILRRVKKDVLQSLPKKTTVTKSCDMTATQLKNYNKLVDRFRDDLNTSGQDFEDDEFDKDEDTGSKEEIKRGAGMLMRLRKAANHPLLLRNHYTDAKLKKLAKLLLTEEQYQHQESEIYIYEDMQLYSDYDMHQLCKKFNSISKFKLADKVIVESGKFAVLDEMLAEIFEKKERVLIFSQFVMMLDIIEEYMNIRGHKFLRLDGSTRVSDRLDLIDDFNSNSSDTFIFLLSTRAGGMGINLTGANHVIIHDIDFNPYNDKQAEDRAHRMGQTKDVTITRLISKDSVEEGMLAIAEKKLRLAENLVDSKYSKEEDKRDLKSLLQNALKPRRSSR